MSKITINEEHKPRSSKSYLYLHDLLDYNASNASGVPFQARTFNLVFNRYERLHILVEINVPTTQLEVFMYIMIVGQELRYGVCCNSTEPGKNYDLALGLGRLKRIITND